MSQPPINDTQIDIATLAGTDTGDLVQLEDVGSPAVAGLPAVDGSQILNLPGLVAVVDDTTPLLGGTLGVNGFSIANGSASLSLHSATPSTLTAATGSLGQQLAISGGVGTSGNGGAITLTGGYSVSGTGGAAQLVGGRGAASIGGDVTLTPGQGSTTTNGGNITMASALLSTVAPLVSFAEAAANGTMAISLKAPDSMAGVGSPPEGPVWTLPQDDPSTAAGKFLTTDASGVLSFATSAGISDVVDDTTPQLGGDLDVNGKNLTDSVNGSFSITGHWNAGGAGNLLTITAGGSGSGAGGAAILAGAQGSTSGGGVTIKGGLGQSTNGGDVALLGGNGVTSAGNVRLQVGITSGSPTLDGYASLESNAASSTAPIFRFEEAGINGSNYIALKAPDLLSAINRTWTLPADDPSMVAGQFLTTDASGVLSFSNPSSTYVPLTITADATAARILALTDAGDYVRMSNAGANTVTVPLNSSVAFAIGTEIIVRQAGAGTTTIVAAGGVTVNTSGTLSLAAQHDSVSLVKVGTDEWDLTGATA